MPGKRMSKYQGKEWVSIRERMSKYQGKEWVSISENKILQWLQIDEHACRKTRLGGGDSPPDLAVLNK